MVQYRKEEQGWRGRLFGEAGSNQTSVGWWQLNGTWSVMFSRKPSDSCCSYQSHCEKHLRLIFHFTPMLHLNKASLFGLTRRNVLISWEWEETDVVDEDGGGGAHRSKSAIKHRSSLPVFNVKVWSITCRRSAAPVSVGKLVHWWLAHSWMKKCNPA